MVDSEEFERPRTVVGPAKDFDPPDQNAAEWDESMNIEEQLQDFSKMNRRGLLNRYIIIGNAEEEYLSCEALRKELDWTDNFRPVAGDSTEIVSIELHSLSSNRDVAHITLRDVKAACTLRSYVLESHPQWKIAHCGPRKASKVLWIGGLPTNNSPVPEATPWYLKPLEELLEHFGKLKGPMRYLAKARCFFISFESQGDAVRARNALFGYPIKPDAFGEIFHLNVDFAGDDDDEEIEFVPRRRHSPRRVSRSRSRRRVSRSLSRSPRREGQRRVQRSSSPSLSRTPVRRRLPPRRSPARLQARRIARRVPAKRLRPLAAARKADVKPAKKRKFAAGMPKETKELKELKELKEPKEPKEPKQEVKKVKEVKEEVVSPKPNADGSTRVNLFKMQEFVCESNAHFVEGNQAMRKGLHDGIRLDIDQRTKVENVVSHKTRSGTRWALWRLAPSNPENTTTYDELGAYFIARQRVGLIQTKLAHIYIIPHDEKFLEALGMKSEEGQILALQIPARQHTAAHIATKELPKNT